MYIVNPILEWPFIHKYLKTHEMFWNIDFFESQTDRPTKPTKPRIIQPSTENLKQKKAIGELET